MYRVRYLIGLVTLLAAVLGAVALFRLLGDEDRASHFHLGVEFRDTQGLLPGADVKYRGVVVGSVYRIKLREDGRKGVITIRLDPGAEGLACTNSRFWIVTPRFAGLAGASGLETLVRDAYVSFLTPEPWGAPLADGSAVLGRERPHNEDATAALDPIRRGDLVMTLVVPENHQLVPGSEVVFRGVHTGEVRSVRLAPDGAYVRIELRIDRDYRQTITDKTRFWVARPRVSGALMGGFAVQDLGALLSPFVSYHTEQGVGLPVPDGYLVAAEIERPPVELPKVGALPAEAGSTSASVGQGPSVQLVHLVYEAQEEDWLSANDEIRREGSGILYEDAEGRLLVVTTRSVVDGSYFFGDVLGSSPEVIGEGIRVLLADGAVHRALRTWVAPPGFDLAILVLDVEETARSSIATTALAQLDFAPPDAEGVLQLEFTGKDGNTAAVTWSPTESAVVDDRRGAAAMRNGRVLGVLGQSADGRSAVLVPLSVIPPVLRPPK